MAKRRNKVLRFFLHKKTMDEHTEQSVENAQAPVEETVVNVPPQAPAEENEEQASEAIPVSEDRSAFNCSACGGEGLKDQSTLCSACNGTGKVG